jgi:hypothetical protein
MRDPITSEGGKIAQEPPQEQIYVEELNMGRGEIGCYVEWKNLRDGWILAENTDSFVSVDNHR